MPDPTNDSLAEVARQKLKSLRRAAWDAYKDSQNLRAATLYGQALELAESIGDASEVVSCRFGRATFLSQAGKLRDGLAVLAPVFQERSSSGKAEDVYNSLTKYLEIALELPASLAAIEKAFAQTESFLESSGHADWRHKLLQLRADLAESRGSYREALSLAQESWAICKFDYPSFTEDTHLSFLVKVNLTLRDAAQARSYLTEWEHHPDNYQPKWRETAICWLQSELARLERQPAEAVDWARRSLLVAEQTEEPNLVIKSLTTLARSFLSGGECARAREQVLRLSRSRHSESRHNYYKAHLLRGDYHLACARQAAGMEPADDVYGSSFPPPTHVANPDATHHSLQRARAAYALALKVGREIDEKLECTYRQDTLAERLARVAAIAQSL